MDNTPGGLGPLKVVVLVSYYFLKTRLQRCTRVFLFTRNKRRSVAAPSVAAKGDPFSA